MFGLKKKEIALIAIGKGTIHYVNGRPRCEYRGTTWKVEEISNDPLEDNTIVNILSIDENRCCTLIVETVSK